MAKKTKVTHSKKYDIRYSDLRDLETLRTWMKTKGMLHWFPPASAEELENFLNIWISFSRYNAALTAVYQDTPVGMGVLFLMPYRKVAHQCMFQLIVDPQFQKQGVGSSLVKNLKHLAKTQFRQEYMYAEIFDESPLIELLKKHGFTELARQEKYVKEKQRYFPRIIMGCDLL